MNFFQKIKDGLSKTKQAMISRFQKVINSFTKIDEDLFEELEETMIMSDIGVDTSVEICEQLRKRVKERGITDPKEIMGLIQEIIAEMMGEDTAIDTSTTPSIIMVIGVNGVGKTTTIGKLCYQYKQQGKKVLVAAADTFRAAAIDQLEIWTKRAGVELVKHSEGSDPGAVIFDAITAGKARGADIIICDTAGRLHNKKNLMSELSKINRIVAQQAEGCARETLLVLDATTGQNAVNQAKMFSETADITGIVLTKLDGTAKGGIVISIKNELNIPVKLVGVGEKIDDLQPFNSEDFVKALFDMDFENAEKSNYDRITDDGTVTTKEDFTIVPDDVPTVKVEEKSTKEDKSKSREKSKLDGMNEKEIYEKIQKIKNDKKKKLQQENKPPVEEKSVETPKAEPVDVKKVKKIKESKQVEKVKEVEEVKVEVKETSNPKAEKVKVEVEPETTISNTTSTPTATETQSEPETTQNSVIEPVLRTNESYVPVIDEAFLQSTREFEAIKPDKPVHKQHADDEEFTPVIEDTPTVIEDEPIPNRQEFEPIPEDEYYSDEEEYYEDDEYYEDGYYDENGEYYDDPYYDENGEYYDDEYYEDYPVEEEVQNQPKKDKKEKKEGFFSKLFGKKDNSKKKDKNNKKKK
jgi:fused signal recognition particle receptor